MVGYNNPYRRSLPKDCSLPNECSNHLSRLPSIAVLQSDERLKRCIDETLDGGHSCNAPIIAYPSAPLAQYTPLRVASSSNFPLPWPPANSHSTGQYTVPEDFENIPPTAGAARHGSDRKSKKRKHGGALDPTLGDKRLRQDKAQAYPHHQQYQTSYDLAHNMGRASPRVYDTSIRTYSPLNQQDTIPAAPSSHIPFGAPSPPGAAWYEQRQLDRQHDQCKQDTISRHVYPTPLEQSPRLSGPPRGTQYNPLEIASSPEPEFHAISHSKKKKKGKKNFYAVAAGHVPGIYTNWDDVQKQIKGFSGMKQQGFTTETEARAWLEKHRTVPKPQLSSGGSFVRQSERSARTQQSFIPVQACAPAQLADKTLPKPVNLTQALPRNATSSLTGSDASDFIPFPSSSQSTAPLLNNNTFSTDPEPVLKPEQQKVVDLILQGRNVFYTGSAGCGKSTILKAFVKQLKGKSKKVHIIAPTNLAALAVGGKTTWNYAGWKPDNMKKTLEELEAAAHGKEVWKRFNTTDVLVIDEISMVENLLFERLSAVMKAARQSGKAFGGVQMVVTGDFCQLSPVKPFQYCIDCGEALEGDDKRSPTSYKCKNQKCYQDTFYDIDKWAFRSRAWEECNFEHINLTQIHRQNDKKFISILQKIRLEGAILPNHANILLNHTSETEGAIEIFSRRFDVDRINNQKINELPSVARTYRCEDNFLWRAHHRSDALLQKHTYKGATENTLQSLNDHRYEAQVQFKQGMRIVLQQNLEPEAGLVNGTQGTVVDFEPYDSNKMPRPSNNKNDTGTGDAPLLSGDYALYREGQIKLYAEANGFQPWPVVKFDNGLVKTIYPDCTTNEYGSDEPYSILSRTQIPLMAGYAITVHKSQGMTLERVIVDLALAFEPSQMYVALSRARSLRGLKVVGLPQRDLGGTNTQVKEFYETFIHKK